MRRATIRLKIVLYSSVLLVALIAAMLIAVNYLGERYVGKQIQGDIVLGRNQVEPAERQRIRELLKTANSLTSNTRLRPLFFDPDGGPTVREILLSYQQENKQTDLLLIVLHEDGRVFTRSDRTDTKPVPSLMPVLAALPDPSTSVVAIDIDGSAYHVVLVPFGAGDQIYGYLAAATPIDKAFVTVLEKLSNDEIVIATETSAISSQRERLPWQNRAQWAAALPPGGAATAFNVGQDRYEGVTTLLGGEMIGIRPLVVIMQSHDLAMKPYRDIQAILLFIGGLAALVGVTLSVAFARSVTAPVAKLVEGTRQVAAGNFDCRIDVRTGDEIGELAQSFNVMTQGLRERADMQKFVSQSTVDMIQSSEQKKVSAGERVTLTIFFSDMRGFTAMTENAPPEETVRMLNSCLSLQAARVKKFHGDIDKFVGDCVVALFTGEDMELNAIRCAVEIHRALDALNEADPNHAPLRVGIGIVRGEVVLGSIGSADRLDYTVIGSNVNLCSRLCSKAGPRETLISESTFAAVDGLVAVDKLDPIPMKGFTEPVSVYRIGGKARG